MCAARLCWLEIPFQAGLVQMAPGQPGQQIIGPMQYHTGPQKPFAQGDAKRLAKGLYKLLWWWRLRTTW